jgi:uncharacterized protein
MKAAPVIGKERIAALDIIRGFALLGILLVNMPAFHSPDFLRQMYSLPENLSPSDGWVRLFFDMFVQTKFYTIFSFLFGLGFYIFISRAEQKGLAMYRLFSRRLLILLIFGLLHLVLLWYGDILHTYALIGFLLLFFYKRSNKTIIGWAFGLLFAFYALLTAQLLFEPASFIAQRQAIGTEKLGEAIKMYQDVSYPDWITYRAKTEVTVILSNTPFLIPSILPMFLFGLYAGRRGIFQHPAQHVIFIKRVWFISMLLSIPLTVLVALLHFEVLSFGARQSLARQLFVHLSGLALCFFYISSLTLVLKKSDWQKRLRPLGFVGQMALTNYLMQTMLALSIVFAFDLFNNMSLTAGMFLSLGIYFLQIVFSSLWLRKYRFGPFEWLWRSLTYGQIQPIK